MMRWAPLIAKLMTPSTCVCIRADQGHGFMPSYVYRQLYEWYHKADW